MPARHKWRKQLRDGNDLRYVDGNDDNGNFLAKSERARSIRDLYSDRFGHLWHANRQCHFQGWSDGAGNRTVERTTATFNTASLTVGTHSITATYNGDANFAAGTSGVLVQTVAQAATATTLVSSLNPSEFGKPVTFTATVTSSGGTPTGTVTFNDGGVAIGTATLAAGIASFTTSSLTIGSHAITASYAAPQISAPAPRRH